MSSKMSLCYCMHLYHSKVLLRLPHWSLQNVNSKATYSSSNHTYYEVLEVPSTCSQSDIKKAFVRLSKEAHPDMWPSSQSSHQHDKFIALNNAYSILSKTMSRAQYDNFLSERIHRRKMAEAYGRGTETAGENVIFRDSSFWVHKDRSTDNASSNKAYYEEAWIKNKKRNSHMVSGILLFIAMGMVFNYCVLRKLASISKRKADARDAEISNIYQRVRDRALSSSRKSQIEAFTQEIEREKREGIVVSRGEHQNRLHTILQHPSN